ncbi:MAG: cytochrome P450 [Chloroflexi bacterium]|nr:MAG: cytochrome P450 [Chloroflexota bacterium]
MTVAQRTGAVTRLEDVELYDPDVYVRGVPHDMFALLRREAPVHWQREAHGPGYWAITRYDDVVQVSRDSATFSSAVGSALLEDPWTPEDLASMQLMMLNMDPPRHSKLRSLVNKGFTPRMITQLKEQVRDRCRMIVDAVAERGSCDFVTEIAAELPLQVIADMVGIPQMDRRQIFEWSNKLIGFDDPEFQNSREEAQLVSMQMYEYANQLALQRRDSAQDDLVSVLMRAEVDGERLSELEFDLFFLLLAVAGNETTRNLISGGMLALIEQPEQRRRLLDDRSLLDTAVEEMLRWVTPVMQFRRTATTDTEIRGQRIRANEKVVIYYPSANHDEDVFPDPDRFDVGRSPNEHLTFGGGGTHFCLGANLARLEIRLIFEELLNRLPDVELAGPARRLRSNFINGIKEMPVRFTPQPAGG